ncbi:MAG: acetyl-CoA carboxylase biotin carboxylase subunit [Chloroflexota bacterium]|nr:acetyl-CoA carboxylase biotin carboxylase subunit [Chloroflexota bacterium]
MFERVLIANRGEIALRIIRACHELGVQAVVAYSEADRDTLPVRLADEALCIGPAAPARSYLHIPSIISAAEMTGCDAIHPGYGFLSENPYIAEICDKVGITFIGPSAAAIQAMANKVEARKLMREAGLPIIPGTEEALLNAEEARVVAQEVGFPLLLKAAGGGGGRGMRVVNSPDELTDAYNMARGEASLAFGNPDVYMERYLTRPRHIEVQVLADLFGNVVHLGTRDCSLQRRHQKIVEEAPAPGLPARLTEAIGSAAVLGTKAINYSTVGTFEFLLDSAGAFFFIEMNTRIQVEHGITEMVTGIDLVKWQIRTAAGEKLTLKQSDIKISGHAIECRINAEDVEKGFLPGGGLIELYLPPGGPGVRVDSHLYSGYKAPSNYDSLLGKLMTWGGTREEAIARMKRALVECIIIGLPTTIPFHKQILEDERFARGEVHTGLVGDWQEEHAAPAANRKEKTAAASTPSATSTPSTNGLVG